MKFKCKNKQCNFKSNIQLKECPECGGEIKKGKGCLFIGVITLISLFSLFMVTGMSISIYYALKFEKNINKHYEDLQSSFENGDFKETRKLLKNFKFYGQSDYKDVRQYDKKIKVGVLLRKLKSTKKDKTKLIVSIYRNILKLEPANAEYQKSLNEFEEKYRLERIQRRTTELLKLNDSDLDRIVKIYTELTKLDPENQLFTDKLNEFQSKLIKKTIVDLVAEAKALPETQFLKKYSIYKKLVKLKPEDQSFKVELAKYKRMADDYREKKIKIALAKKENERRRKIDQLRKKYKVDRFGNRTFSKTFKIITIDNVIYQFAEYVIEEMEDIEDAPKGLIKNVEFRCITQLRDKYGKKTDGLLVQLVIPFDEYYKYDESIRGDPYSIRPTLKQWIMFSLSGVRPSFD